MLDSSTQRPGGGGGGGGGGGSPRRHPLRSPLAICVQGALLCALALGLAKLGTARLSQRPVCHPVYVKSAEATGGGAAAGLPPAATAAADVHPCCAWNPYLLSLEAQRWAIDAARFDVPTLVYPWRRQLSMLLAMGALEQGVPGDFVETGTYKVRQRWDSNQAPGQQPPRAAAAGCRRWGAGCAAGVAGAGWRSAAPALMCGRGAPSCSCPALWLAGSARPAPSAACARVPCRVAWRYCCSRR